MWRRVWRMTRKGKRGLRYAVQWYDDAARMRTESCGPSKRIAEELRRRREMELNAGLLQSTRAIRLAAFGRDYLSLVAPQLAKATVVDHAMVLRHLQGWAGDVWMESLTRAMMERYVAHRAAMVKAATVNREIRTLRSTFERARTLGYLRQNPLKGWKMLRETRRIFDVPRLDSIQRLLAACPTLAWRAFVYLALSAGLRRGEIGALRWEDVDLAGGLITVRSTALHRTKSQRERRLPLVGEASDLLAAVRQRSASPWVFTNRQGGPWRQATFKQFGRIREAAGLRGYTIQDMRRTFCSHLAMAGVPQPVIQDLAGHASSETTRRYYQRILPEAHRAAAEKLPWIALPISTKSERAGERAGRGKRA